MRIPRRTFLQLAAGAAALPVVPHLARAQDYPSRPVRVIVPFAPGGQTDVVARLIAQKLSDRLGKQFYVENAAGAGGNIGAGRAVQAAPAAAGSPVSGDAPEREEFLRVYEASGRSVRATSKHFGRDRRQIYRWLEAFGVERPKSKS